MLCYFKVLTTAAKTFVSRMKCLYNEHLCMLISGLKITPRGEIGLSLAGCRIRDVVLLLFP